MKWNWSSLFPRSRACSHIHLPTSHTLVRANFFRFRKCLSSTAPPLLQFLQSAHKPSPATRHSSQNTQSKAHKTLPAHTHTHTHLWSPSSRNRRPTKSFPHHRTLPLVDLFPKPPPHNHRPAHTHTPLVDQVLILIVGIAADPYWHLTCYPNTYKM